MGTVAGRNRAGVFVGISIAATLAVAACSTGRLLERDAGGPDGVDPDGTGGTGSGGTAVSGTGGRGTGGMATPIGSGGGTVIGTGGNAAIGTGGRGSAGMGAGSGGTGGFVTPIGSGGRGSGGVINPGTGGGSTGGSVLPGTGGMGTGGAGCPLPQTSCSGTCRDITSDVHNCGACGRDCQFGTCLASQCQPVVLVTGTEVLDVASDGTSVYALDYARGIFYGCTLAQCGNGGNMIAFRTGLASPEHFLLLPSVGSVFVDQLGAGSVYRFSLAGALLAVITVPMAGATRGLASDGTNLFIGTGGEIPGIERTSLGTNNPAPVFPSLATNLFYDPVSNAIFADQVDRIAKCPVGGTSCTLFYTLPVPVTGMALAGGRFVFLLDGVPGTPATNGLFSCSTTAATCMPTPLLAFPAYSLPYALGADASFAYMSIAPAGQAAGIYRCALAGCGGVATPVLVPTPGAININTMDFATDANALYWSNSGGTPASTGVLRLAKQP